MSESEGKPAERYYLYYRRELVLSLIFMLCLAVYFLVGLFSAAPGRRWLVGLIISACYLVLMLALQLLTLRGRRWRVRDREARTVLGDEWLRASRSRAFQTAFWVMLGAQWPMMFVVAYAPPEPSIGSSVVGMGTLTMVLGLGAFVGSYLYYSRQPSDG